MALLVRLFLGLYLASLIFLALPSYAEPPVAQTGDSVETAKGTTATPAGSSPLATEESAAQSSSDDDKAREALMRDLNDPAKKKETLGMVAELLGVSSGLMLITGAILAACVKKWNLVKLMLAIGVVGGILAVAAPGLIIMANSQPLGYVFCVSFLLMYIGVFFLPTILALKNNTSKKWIITGVNAAGFLIPGAGLVALFLALKDGPSKSEGIAA